MNRSKVCRALLAAAEALEQRGPLSASGDKSGPRMALDVLGKIRDGIESVGRDGYPSKYVANEITRAAFFLRHKY